MRFKTWPVLARHLRRKGYHGMSLVPVHVLPDLELDPDDGDDLAGENGEDDSCIAFEDEGEDADDVPGGLGRTRRAKRPRTGDNDENEDIASAGSTSNAKRHNVRTAESEDEEAIVEEAVTHEDDDDVPNPSFEPSKSPAVVSPEQEDVPCTSTPIKRDFYTNLFPESLYADASPSPSHVSFDSPAVVDPEQEAETESADGEDEDWNMGMILDAQPTSDDSATEDPEDWSLV
ncbi:hypothetical protein EXIGLDRAFT_833442 [Exidia glandulosa HHB12029]|uniref:Uncharacterized protein n=1 Tax=Exidia glandulosa HHB12029 TaxID=1314781 RepID=A0A165KRB8_EXIGL|nr:hypothetical protein EXIGLDRAFT_833442 [Exidia glandulosa HHB12029]